MKFSEKFFYAFMISGGLLVSCVGESSHAGSGDPTDPPTPPPPPSELYYMGFDASVDGSPEARASVDEGNMNDGQNIVFRWDAGDKVVIWTGGDTADLTPCLFTTEKGGLSTARFEYEGDKVESYVYFGYYPYMDGAQYGNIEIDIPTDGTILQTEKNDSRHLRSYRPMYTPVVERNEDSQELTGLSFRHITGLLYFRIQNLSGKDVRVESVTMRCSEKVFSNHALLRFVPGNTDMETELVVSDDSSSESISLSFGSEKQGMVLSNEETMQAFLPLLPVDNLTDTKLTLLLKADGQEYVSLELDGNEINAFKAGANYPFAVTLKPDSIEIEIEPAFEDWEPGDNIDIPLI